MLISCPNCAAGYDVPDYLLVAGGRTLRCARCTREWHQDAPAPAVAESAPVVDVAPVPAAIARDSSQSAASQSGPGPSMGGANHRWLAAAIAAWVVSLVVIGVFAWAMVHWRVQVMAHWPPSARLYQAIGLSVPVPAAKPPAAAASPPA